MRQCFYLKSTDAKGGLWHQKKKLSREEGRVEITFRTLCSISSHKLHALHHVVSEVQYMLDTDHKASELVDSWILEQFSDLAMLSELKSRIGGFEPWAGAWICDDLFNHDYILAKNDKIFALDTKLRNALHETFAEGRIIETVLGDPTAGAFAYPANKRQTAANVKQMRSAEFQLDALWSVVDSLVLDFSNISISKFITQRLLEPRQKHRTHKWVAPETELKRTPCRIRDPNVILPVSTTSDKTSQSAFEVQSPQVSAALAVSGPHIAPGTPATPKLPTEIAQPKIKVKTRGIPAASAVADADVVECTPTTPGCKAENAAPQQVKVPKRAYKVLSMLLPDSKAANHQRAEVSWDEFCQALSLIGFQPQKLYGSVWIFMPRNGEVHDENARRGRRSNINYPWTPTAGATLTRCLVDANRSIQFHEPKEVKKGSKIPYRMLRTFGRRFKHAYGWEDGMFACE